MRVWYFKANHCHTNARARHDLIDCQGNFLVKKEKVLVQGVIDIENIVDFFFGNGQCVTWR